LSREEALASAFPGASIAAERLFLTDEEIRRAHELSGIEIPTALVARYKATRNGIEVGRAYVDTHVVRTKRESLLVILDSGGALMRIEVTAFLEPPEYKASAAWYAQYRGKVLDDELNLQRGIRPVAGATLTAVATNRAVRRVLAMDQVLRQTRNERGRP